MKKDFFYKEFLSSTLTRYFIVGSLSFLCDFLFFALFLTYLNFHYLLAAVLSFILATSLNFYLSKNFAFKGMQKFSTHGTLVLIFLASGISLLVNIGALFAYFELLSINIFISKFLAAATGFVFNYLSRKYIIFKYN